VCSKLPVKANLSTTTTGSIGVVCACTWISTNDASRSSPIDDRRYVFSRFRMEKECSGVAVVTGKVTSTCSRMDRFGYSIQGCIASCVCIQCSLGWFRCSMPALLPQLKLGSELVVTVVDGRLIHFHRRYLAEHRIHTGWSALLLSR